MNLRPISKTLPVALLPVVAHSAPLPAPKAAHHSGGPVLTVVDLVEAEKTLPHNQRAIKKLLNRPIQLDLHPIADTPYFVAAGDNAIRFACPAADGFKGGELTTKLSSFDIDEGGAGTYILLDTCGGGTGAAANDADVAAK